MRMPNGGRPAHRGGGFHGGAHSMIGRGVKPQDTRASAVRLWGYMKRYRGRLLSVLLLVGVTSGLSLLNPYLLGLAIDRYIIPGNLPGLLGIVLLMLGLTLFTALTTWLETVIMVGASQRTVRDLRKELFDKIQTLSLRYFDSRPHGEIMSRLTNDVENISQVLTQGAIQLITSVLSLAGVMFMMIYLDLRLAIVSLLTIPLMVLLTSFVARRTRLGFRAQQENLGRLNGIIEETVTGQRVVKAFSREEEVIDKFDGANNRLRKSAVTAQIYAGVLPPLTNLVSNMSFALIAAAGGFMVLGGGTTVGTVAAFINYSRQFARPLNQVASLYNTIQSALAGAERVFQVLDEVPEISNAEDAAALHRTEGHVSFQNVCFAYKPGLPVLKNVSFEAQPGKNIALVGPTGAGKTTIVNLLTRFYDIDSGSICMDGRDLRTLRIDDLRSQLGIVLQDTFLFSESVMENIRYGRPDASDDEVITAARVANADQFIHRLPEGYGTLLSEEGGNLSQGQRQLIAIARVVLADPSVLILDEATSSVDTRTEQHIQEAIMRLMEGRTSFIIAHRLSTIRSADCILVIDKGGLVERGTHAELLEQKGFYHELYTSQYRGLTSS